MTNLPAALVLAAAALVALGGCGPAESAGPPSTGGRLTVVATTTVLADFVRRVGGDRLDVHSLVPAGTDVHTFDPAPSDVARLSAARLLVMNGLGLDDSLLELARDGGAADVPVVELGENLDGVEYIEGDDDHAEEGEAQDDDHGDEEDDSHRLNPHLWLDASIAGRYVERLADALADADPAGSTVYAANAASYAAELAELDGWIRDTMAAVPAEHRRVVSFHGALPYFARAYGLEIVGVVVESPGQEPSAAEVAALIEAIRQAGARAILAEAQFSDRLAETIADETGAAVISGLHTDSLGDAPADSYVGAMRWNTEQILAGLQ